MKVNFGPSQSSENPEFPGRTASLAGLNHTPPSLLMVNDSRSVTSKYAVDPFNTFFVIPTENPDRDYFALAVGVSAVFSRGISSFLNYETVLGLKDVTSHAFTGGVRLEF